MPQQRLLVLRPSTVKFKKKEKHKFVEMETCTQGVCRVETGVMQPQAEELAETRRETGTRSFSTSREGAEPCSPWCSSSGLQNSEITNVNCLSQPESCQALEFLSYIPQLSELHPAHRNLSTNVPWWYLENRLMVARRKSGGKGYLGSFGGTVPTAVF